ncbi:DUF1684 domain-containing protein [Streptomyces sp. NBC_00459]|uniref:DUF1684 domain-containing protein n=1 Tax=Streptomyces sp. NBC_00459 TaxID=2975749 RepID=UPI002E19EAEB
MTGDGSEAWQERHERRIETASAPYGPLALVGTHWLEDFPDGRLPAITGRWTVDGDTVVPAAGAADGLTLDGEPFTGEIRLPADQGPAGEARVGLGERRLVVLVREGSWGVRDFDPDAETRTAFKGIEATSYDPRWSVSGRFTPYDGRRTVRVANADGRERGLGLGGELTFSLDGQEQTLRVTVDEDGTLWAVFADSTSGDGSYRFRFLRPVAPDVEGRTTVDFNRSLLPPGAFADHFVCPFPQPGNTLGVAIAAGERNLR